MAYLCNGRIVILNRKHLICAERYDEKGKETVLLSFVAALFRGRSAGKTSQDTVSLEPVNREDFCMCKHLTRPFEIMQFSLAVQGRKKGKQE